MKKKRNISGPEASCMILALGCLVPLGFFVFLLFYITTYVPWYEGKRKAMAEEERSVIAYHLGKAVASHLPYSTLTSGTHPVLRERERTSTSLALHETYINSSEPQPSAYEHRAWEGGESGGWQYRIGIALDRQGNVTAYNATLFYSGTGNF